MARYRRLETLLLMKEIGVIPVFYNSDFEVAREVACACADGGARVVEFTNRGDRAIDVFTKLEEFCAKERRDIALGVGSIVGRADGCDVHRGRRLFCRWAAA